MERLEFIFSDSPQKGDSVTQAVRWLGMKLQNLSRLAVSELRNYEGKG